MLGGRPFLGVSSNRRFQTAPSPSESRHGLHAVEKGGVFAGVLVALVVPGGDAVDGAVFLQQADGLAEVAEEVWGHVQVLFNDDGVGCFLNRIQ